MRELPLQREEEERMRGTGVSHTGIKSFQIPDGFHPLTAP